MLDNPRPGYNLAAEYQVPGIPWLTSSIAMGVVRWDFPQVTKNIFVRNFAGTGSVKIGFTLNGLNGSNNRSLAPGEIFDNELRCTQLFISGSGNTVEIVASLTGILTRDAQALSASNGNQGVG